MRERRRGGRRLRTGIVDSSSYLMREINAQESGGRERLIDKTRSCFVRCLLWLKMLVMSLMS